MSLSFGAPKFGAPRRRVVPTEAVTEFDVERVRRIAEHRLGMVHPHDENEPEQEAD